MGNILCPPASPYGDESFKPNYVTDEYSEYMMPDSPRKRPKSLVFEFP